MLCLGRLHVEWFFTIWSKTLNRKLIIHDHVTHFDIESVFAIRYRICRYGLWQDVFKFIPEFTGRSEFAFLQFFFKSIRVSDLDSEHHAHPSRPYALHIRWASTVFNYRDRRDSEIAKCAGLIQFQYALAVFQDDDI